MKYSFVLLFLFGNCLGSYGDGHHNHWGAEEYNVACRTPIAQRAVSTSSESSDEDMLCNAASEVFEKYKKPCVPCIKDHIRRVIEEETHSPLTDKTNMESSLRHIRSGDPCNNDTASINYLHDLIIKASALALVAQQEDLAAKQAKIDSKWNKKQVTALCSVASTVIAAASSLLVNYLKSC